MRSLIAFLVLICALPAIARDIRTLKGELFHEVTITKTEATGIHILYPDGVAFLDFSELPEDIKKEFGYSAESYALGREQKKQAYIAAQQTLQATAALKSQQDAERARIKAEVQAAAIARYTVNRTTRNYTERDYSVPVYIQPRYSSYSSDSYGGRSKTVHVSGYTRKDGTYVHSYSRRPPRR